MQPSPRAELPGRYLQVCAFAWFPLSLIFSLESSAGEKVSRSFPFVANSFCTVGLSTDPAPPPFRALRRPRSAQRRFGPVEIPDIPRRIDERIRSAALQGFHLARQVEIPTVPRQEMSQGRARKVAMDFSKSCTISGVLGISHQPVIRRGETARDHHPVGTRPIRNRRRPTGAALGVPGREVRRQNQPAQLHWLAVAEQSIGSHGRERVSVSQLEIPAAAGCKQRSIGGARRNRAFVRALMAASPPA